MTSHLYLVACVGSKKSEPAPARDLYQSTWFAKARSYVESHHGDWLILSAQHGLVDPASVIAPYEQTLTTMPATARREWAAMVERQIQDQAIGASRIVVLAGQRYREFLIPALERVADQVDIPMQGLGIGRQLQWLDANTQNRPIQHKRIEQHDQ